MSLGISAIIVQWLVTGYLYPFYYDSQKNPILHDVKFNLIVGLMTYAAMGFATVAKIKIESISLFLIYHTIFQFIQFSLTGIVLGWIYGKKKIARIAS